MSVWCQVDIRDSACGVTDSSVPSLYTVDEAMWIVTCVLTFAADTENDECYNGNKAADSSNDAVPSRRVLPYILDVVKVTNVNHFVSIQHLMRKYITKAKIISFCSETL